MYRKPFNLDSALEDFRQDIASPEAHRRAQHALATGQPHRSWRLVAVGGALVLLVIPVALRTKNSSAIALTLGQALRVSKDAPYVMQKMDKRDLQGRLVDHEELIWAPHRFVQRSFFHDGVPGTETRHGHDFIFERQIPERRSGRDVWRPYESISKTNDAVVGTEGGSYFQSQNALLANLKSLKPVRMEKGFAWFQLSPGNVWTVEVATNRIVRTETKGKDGTFISDFKFPDYIDRSLLDIPPLGQLPRFDYDQERADMDRLNRKGDRVATVGGRKVKLVGVFQEICAPQQPIYVSFEGKGLARVRGYSAGFSTTMSQSPKIVATVFFAPSTVRTVDVEIPVPGTAGFVKVEKVRVRPVSYRIRNALRTPPY